MLYMLIKYEHVNVSILIKNQYSTSYTVIYFSRLALYCNALIEHLSLCIVPSIMYYTEDQCGFECVQRGILQY